MLRVSPVSAFRDNYIWLIHNDKDAIAVDPGDAAPVEAFLKETVLPWSRCSLRTITLTMWAVSPSLSPVETFPYMARSMREIPTLTRRLTEGDRFRFRN